MRLNAYCRKSGLCAAGLNIGIYEGMSGKGMHTSTRERTNRVEVEIPLRKETGTRRLIPDEQSIHGRVLKPGGYLTSSNHTAGVLP